VIIEYRKLLDIDDMIKEIEDGAVDDSLQDDLLEAGDRLQEEGEYEDSIACYDKAIEIDPKWVSPWLGKGMTYWKSKKYEEAITCYDKANDLLKYATGFTGFCESATDEIWRSKGGIYAHWGKYEEAITCYDKVIELHSNPFSWNSKGRALEKLGRHEEAKECFAKATTLSSS